MKLRRIEIRDFRKLVGPVSIDGLGDGLTVIAGDNEEGKSTVLAALKAVFFEPYRVGGQVKEAMRGHAGGDPEITVEFELGGAAYSLRKQFGRNGVQLVGPHGRLTGDAAETRLTELLRFRPRAGNAKPAAEHLGLQGLFWIDQGTTFQDLDAIAINRDRIDAAIGAEVGTILRGDAASRLVQRIEVRHERFFDKRDKIRVASDLGRLKTKVAELEPEIEALRQVRAAYDELIEDLTKAKEEQQRFLRNDHIGKEQQKLRACRAALTAIEGLEQEARLAQAKLQALEAECRQVESRRTELQRLADALAKGRVALAHGAQAVDERRAELRLAEGAFARAQQRHLQAATEAADCRRRLQLAQAAAEAMRAQATIQRLCANEQEIAAANDQIRAWRAELETNRATPDRLKAIERAAAEVERQTIALSVVATRLEFPPGTAAVRIAGRAVDVSQPLRLTERTELDLDGFGRLVVLPGGGGDLAERRRALDAARDELAAALAQVGAADPRAARAANQRRQQLQADTTRRQDQIAAILSAEGCADLEVLRQRLETLRQAVVQVRADAGEGVDLASLAELVDELWRAVEQSERVLQHARTEEGAAQQSLGAAREAVAKLEGRQGELQRQVDELANRQHEATATVSTEQLALQSSRLSAEVAEAHAAAAKLTADLRARDPEAVRDQLQRSERAIRELEAEQRRLDDKVLALQGRVHGQGVAACDERLEELERELAFNRQQLARVEREAAAWRLLRDELRKADSAARDRLAEPVRARMTPYLQRLFPDAAPIIDSGTFRLTGLRRQHTEESFTSLSVGTREQLAVLVRLALAKLLQEREGEAPCLILDDALVYADEARFERIKTILERAAAELQIIVLTCRPRDYAGLDARRLRLDECRLSA